MPEVHLVNLEKVEFFGGEEDKKKRNTSENSFD